MRDLADKGVTLVHMMHVALSQGIQPLQSRAHPMHQYTGEDDPTRANRGPFFASKFIQEMLSLLFKGKMSDFPTALSNMGFSATVLVAEVNITRLFRLCQSS